MYDLAVYLPGGAVALVLAHQFVENYVSLPASIYGEQNVAAVGQVITAVVWLSASYLAGHIVAFVSSYLIEKFVHYNLGYPSEIWVESEDVLHEGTEVLDHQVIFEQNLRESHAKFLISKLILLSQVPATIPLLLVRFIKPFGFYTPKLPAGLKPKVTEKFGRFNFDVKIEKGTRWEKIIEHYVSNNCPVAYTRLYNYLVIYGALRTLALLVLAYLWMMIIYDVILKINGGWKLDLTATIYFNALTFVYILCLMAFAKFNRRFFEESILAFLFGDGDVRKVT